MYRELELIELIHRLALKKGTFTLASGKTASFYLDCRRVTLDSRGANVVASGILEMLDDDWPECVGGMAIGADPITGAVITLAGQRGRALNGFIVRKEAKGHGTGRVVEGPVEPGQRAVVLEDVVTSGGSLIAAVERAREFGLVVDRAIAIVDREEGAAEAFEALGIHFRSLLTAGQLGIGAQAS